MSTINDATTITEIATASLTWQRNVKDLEEAEKAVKLAEEDLKKKQAHRDLKAKGVADAAERVRRLSKQL